MREFACVVGANCNSPMLQFVHIVNLSMLQIRSHYNSPMWMGELQFAHIAKFIHVAKFIHISNSPMWKGELQFAPTRVFSGCWQIYM